MANSTCLRCEILTDSLVQTRLRSSGDRALVSGTKGRRFESSRGHHTLFSNLFCLGSVALFPRLLISGFSQKVLGRKPYGYEDILNQCCSWGINVCSLPHILDDCVKRLPPWNKIEVYMEECQVVKVYGSG